MGKIDEAQNIPANPSLSYTLNHLLSNVKLEIYSGPEDIWEPLEIPGYPVFELSSLGQKRYLQHLQRLKAFFNYEGQFIVRSSNNFPLGTGLASSASSFAALTKCACLALSELSQQELPSIETQAQWSRLGSGSSCRSFFSPWAIWDQKKVEAIDIPYQNLIHHVVLVSSVEKSISSRAAHLQIHSSPNYRFRPSRAKNRLENLLTAFRQSQWQEAYEICWDEFMDMHELFHTADPSFSYMTDKTREILQELKNFWHTHQDGPIITMDAGPNVHLLFRQDQKDMAQHILHEYLVNQFNFL
jgi:diphosphomevalonate decarboxylase